MLFRNMQRKRVSFFFPCGVELGREGNLLGLNRVVLCFLSWAYLFVVRLFPNNSFRDLNYHLSTMLGDRSFAAAAAQLWSSLPYSIRSSSSVASFKKTLKTFLFQKAFL